MKQFKEKFIKVAKAFRLAVYICMGVRIAVAVVYRIYCINRVNEG